MRAITVLPNGDVVVGGSFLQVGGVTTQGIGRWDGATWSRLGATGIAGAVAGFAVDAYGALAVGGAFAGAGPLVGANVLRFVTVCVASSYSAPSGCAAGVGPTLTPRSMAWAGTTLRARATGMPAGTIGLWIVSPITLTIGLDGFLPAAPGCMLMVSPDYVGAFLPVAGAFDTAFPLPSDPTLSGFPIHSQVVALDLAGQSTSSNKLLDVVGSY